MSSEQSILGRLNSLEKQNRRMRRIGIAAISIAASFLVMAQKPSVPQTLEAKEFVLLDSSGRRRMADQARCARLVKANMKATQEQSPEVYKTIATYLYEYSTKSQSCVMIMNYKTKGNDGNPAIQVLALNAVTMQPMSGYKDIFLIPEGNKQEIIDATNFLFDKWSK